MTIREVKKIGISALKSENTDSILPEYHTAQKKDRKFTVSPTPALDADCFIESVTGRSRTWLISHSDSEMTESQIEQFFNCIAVRRTGLPVAYITGHKEFYGIDFIVTPDVLIPKPDTELLVETALAELKLLCTKKASVRLADICTGSGCIAISVLHEIPCPEKITAFAADISSGALAVAEKNADMLLASDTRRRLAFVQGDLLDACVMESCGGSPFDMILSNPPYIPSAMVDSLLQDGRSEPRLALDGDPYISSADMENDGLSIIRRLIPQAFSALASGGVFLMETGEYNAEKAAALTEKAGFTQVEVLRDLAGLLRLVLGRKI